MTITREITLDILSDAPQFVVHRRPVARLNPPRVHPAGVRDLNAAPALARVAVQMDAAGTATIHYAGLGWAVHDAIAQIGPGEYRVVRTWGNKTAAAQEEILECRVEHLGDDLTYLIPGVSYNGNHWGGGQEPKGLHDAAHGGARWVFGGDRSSIPACTISEGAGLALALYATPEDAAETGCTLEPASGGLCHCLYWPLQEQPRAYVRRDQYGPAIGHSITLAPGASYTRTFFVTICSAPKRWAGVAHILDAAWRRFSVHVPATFSPQQLWALGVQFAKESLWIESDQFTGFSIGLTRQDGQWVQHPHVRYEIGWCGQNAGYAAMLLQDYLWHGDEDSWRRGAAVLDFWVQHARFANRLFYTHYEHKLAGIANPELDTCNLGQGAYLFLLAAELAARAGRPQPQWRALGLAACDFFVQHALANGKLGRSWWADGTVAQEDGTSGCSIVWALTKAYRLTGDDACLATATKAYRAYAADDLARWQCTAGALDTDCIDKETAFALLLPGLDLYEITNDSYYLAQAEQAAYYLASWQWHYNLAYDPASPAGEMHYATCGGTSVSVQHHHLDPWGALIALGWLRLGRVTGKRIWTDRAAAAWRQATIGVSGGTLALKGVVRPAGGQDEGFYHTRWGGALGDVSDWLVAWPSAFRLLTLQAWDDWALLC